MKANGFDHIFLATNYKSDYIENFFGNGNKYGVKLTISKEDKPLGTAGPVKLLQNQLNDEPFLVMNGDILTLLPYRKLYDFACTKETLLTIGTKDIYTPFQFGNIHTEGDFVTGIEEKPNIKTTILAGIYIFKPEILDLIPDNTMYNMDKLIMDMLTKDLPISHYPIKEYWLDIGQVDDYEKAQNIYKEHFQ